MKPSWSSLIGAMLFGSMLSCFFFSHETNLLIAQQATELQQLRYINATVYRSRHLPAFGGMDYEAVEKASYWTGCPNWVIAGIRRHENGPLGLDCGYHGKTQFVVEHFKEQQWQYAEAGRLATRLAWKFCLSEGEIDKFFPYFGFYYTGPPVKKGTAWGHSVLKLGIEEAGKIHNLKRTSSE